jgi:hypothetical protein
VLGHRRGIDLLAGVHQTGARSKIALKRPHLSLVSSSGAGGRPKMSIALSSDRLLGTVAVRAAPWTPPIQRWANSRGVGDRQLFHSPRRPLDVLEDDQGALVQAAGRRT